MVLSRETDELLIGRIRAGQADAWSELIGRFEGRLLAFVRSRIADRSAAEDVVQETFIGFLTSLPNYDRRRPLETYLFSIAAHKLTDRLRTEGRRPHLPLVGSSHGSSDWEPAYGGRGASSIARSSERRRLEETALVAALAEQIEHWRRRGQWNRLECAELLLVRGCSNKDVAGRLRLSEQMVANYKFELLTTLRQSLRRQSLSEDVFPELYEE